MRKIHKAKGGSYGWVVVAGLHLVMGVGYGIPGTFGVFVNPLNEEMGWSRTAISGAIAIVMFVHLMASGLWALLAERWSIRLIIAGSGLLFSLGIFLVSTADSIWELYLYWGFIGGIGMGGFVSSLPGLITRWFDRKRVLALGIGMAGIGVGLAVLPILTERLIALDGWRLGFRVLSFIAMGTFLLVALVVREPYVTESAEWRESISSSPRSGIPSPRGMKDGFSKKMETTFPEALRTRGFWLLFGIQVVVAVIIQTLQLHLVPRAEDAGVEPSSAATLLMVLGVFSILGKVCGGALGDRFESYWIFTIAMILTVLVMGWLIQSSVLWMFYVFAATYGFVYGSWVPNLAGMTVRLFGSRHMGAIFGGTLIGAGVGAVIGPVMAGYVFDTTGSYFIAFAITAGVAIVGAVLGILIKRESAAVSARI